MQSKQGKVSLAALRQTYPRWRQSLENGATPLRDELPWINFAAIDFLGQTLKPEMRVFEYGSGGSTLFFSERVREVFSVEHDPRWFQNVQNIITQRKQENCHLRLVEPAAAVAKTFGDPSDPDAYVSDDDLFRGRSFKDYATSIDASPQESFDLVLVDGRARPSCLKHAITRTKVGGYVMVDNAERDHYQRSYGLLEGVNWKRQDFFGPGPYNLYFWQTNVWQRLR